VRKKKLNHDDTKRVISNLRRLPNLNK